MFKTRLVLTALLLAAVVVVPVQAITYPHMLDDMNNIAGRPWTDQRDGPGQGAGWLSQGAGVMKIDYSKTYNGDGIAPYLLPNPIADYDYLGNLIGPGLGTFDAAGNYLGDFDRVPSAFFASGDSPGELPNLAPLVANHAFTLDVYKPLTGYGEHVREIQLYDSLGNRNTYIVIGEGGTDLDSPGGPGRSIMNTPAGWTTFTVPLDTPRENNADLSDLILVNIWVSSWAAYSTSPTNPYTPGTPEYDLWPDWGQGDWSVTPNSGLPLLIDNLRLIPEPATMTMLALGGLALLRRRKKA